jgi:hypothetical protein
MNANMLINISKIVALIIIAAIFFSGSIRSIESLRIINLIKKSKKLIALYSKSNISIYLPIIVALIFISYIFRMKTVVGVLTFTCLGIMTLIDPIRTILELKICGVYANGIIYFNYSTDWSHIEKYQELEKGIRLVHKDKGAFDIDIDQSSRKEIMQLIKNIGIEEIIKKNEEI